MTVSDASTYRPASALLQRIGDQMPARAVLVLVASAILTVPIMLSAPAHAEITEGRVVDSDDQSAAKFAAFLMKDRNWFVAPIPTSTPTFGTGLILGSAWFWKQSEAQKASQPPSVTGAAAFVSDNDSKAFGIGHLGFLDGDKWRVGGLAGYVDLNLDLRTAGRIGEPRSIEWLVEGYGFGVQVLRKFADDWYLGLYARYVEVDQAFSLVPPQTDFDLGGTTTSVGLGGKIQFDSRDNQFNPYKGAEFRLSVLANNESLGSDLTYESYSATYASFHTVGQNKVIAWQLRGCHRSDRTPLWDACVIDLRGFNSTQYIGLSSASAQAEFRWRFHRRWGAVGFAGGGYYENALSEFREREVIPSVGVGIRFMLLETQRINVRVDYARSRGDDAWYLGVAEAF